MAAFTFCVPVLCASGLRSQLFSVNERSWRYLRRRTIEYDASPELARHGMLAFRWMPVS